MTDTQKLKAIDGYLRRTRKSLDKALKRDEEYSTSTGNGVNCCEADAMFAEVEKEVGAILND